MLIHVLDTCYNIIRTLKHIYIHSKLAISNYQLANACMLIPVLSYGIKY